MRNSIKVNKKRRATEISREEILTVCNVGFGIWVGVGVFYFYHFVLYPKAPWWLGLWWAVFVAFIGFLQTQIGIRKILQERKKSKI